jgi:threonine dehydrogenase-like Zn-dependent dehydrogenase
MPTAPTASATIGLLSFTARERVEWAERPHAPAALAPDEVAGRTLATLVSPGTELNSIYLAERPEPSLSGYAAVFEVDEVGSAITDLRPGDVVFCAGPHQSRQRARRAALTPVPAGLAPEVAVFARLMAVSWATLVTTTARPPDRAVVLGLGPIGNLAAQIFAAAGYRVTAVDPLPERRTLARRHGLEDVRERATEHAPESREAAQLVLECSGHEQAALDGMRSLRRGGELVLVATPWKKRCELDAHVLLHTAFYRYIRLRSGWEWEVPPQPREFTVGATDANLAAAMRWLEDGRVRVDGMAARAFPREAQSVYQDLLHRRGAPTAVFDWR